jgi:hypothetical protein
MTQMITHAEFIQTEFGTLVGKTVEQVRMMTEKEIKNLAWDGRYGAVPFVVFFTDGSYIVPSMDDEGNGAGTLIYENTSDL